MLQISAWTKRDKHFIKLLNLGWLTPVWKIENFVSYLFVLFVLNEQDTNDTILQ